MIWIIIVALIVLAVLLKIGIFRKPGECKECGKTLKGTEQVVFGGSEKMVLCKECASKIHPPIILRGKMKQRLKGDNSNRMFSMECIRF